MISRLKNSGGPTSRHEATMASSRGLPGLLTFKMLVGILDHHDRGIDHGADCDRDTAETHDIGVESQRPHRQERDQHADRQHDDDNQCAACMQQEHDADQRDDDALLDQRAAQSLDRAMNKVGTIVDCPEADALRQTGGDLLDLELEVADDVECILPIACHRDPADDLAFAVQLSDAPALVRNQLDSGDVTQEDGCPGRRLDDQLLEITDAFQVAPSADDVLRLGHLDGAAADVLVAHADDVAHLPQRDPVGLQLSRIDRDLVGLDEAPDAGDLGDALGLGELIAYEPVLDRTQIRERALRSLHDVLVDPADARGVRPE